MYFLEHSGEHKTLPIAEMLAILEGEGQKYEYFTDFPVTVVSNITKLPDRVALTKHISTLLFETNTTEIYNTLKQINMQNKSFAIRVKKYGKRDIDTKKIEIDGGKLFSNPVNLEHPEVIIRIAITSKAYIGILKYTNLTQALNRRKAEHRPYTTPISLPPKFARTLVNLARVKKGATVLDPFCGAGGILIEAGLMNMHVLGLDIAKTMVHGAIANLNYYSLSGEVYQGDVSEITTLFDKVDAVVTDPPYGRAAFTNKEKIDNLYSRAFKSIMQVLKHNGFLAIILPEIRYVALATQYFALVECHKLKVHRSLTRHFCVFKNSKSM